MGEAIVVSPTTDTSCLDPNLSNTRFQLDCDDPQPEQQVNNVVKGLGNKLKILCIFICSLIEFSI